MEKRFVRGFVHVCGFCRFHCVLPRLLQQAPHHTHTDTLHLPRVSTSSLLCFYTCDSPQTQTCVDLISAQQTQVVHNFYIRTGM